jgi:hypothetical protein
VRRSSLCSVVVGVGLIFGGLVSAASPAGAVPAWSIAPTPNPTALSVAEFSGVSCPTATNCTAVGDADSADLTSSQTFVEHWNGTTWTVVPTDLTVHGQLHAVSCPTATNCTAVGVRGNSALTTAKTLIEHWNGTTWTIVPSPNPTALPLATLTGVSCPTSVNCTAVGFAGNTGLTTVKALIEHWNGTTWTIAASVNPAALPLVLLQGVSCPSATSCTVVGVAENPSSGTVRGLVERWNGKTWTLVASPNPTGQAALNAVSCPTATNCTAVGNVLNAASMVSKTLIERWNGKTWTIVPSPNPTLFPIAGLSGVSCLTATNCTAVGSDYNVAATVAKTLIERWNGKSWTIVPSPNPSALPSPALFAVACATASHCTAIGADYGPTSAAPLAEQYG